MQPTPYPAMPYRPPSAGTAETLILIALILQGIASAVLLLVFGFLSVLAVGIAAAGVPVAGIPALIFLLIAVVAIVFLYVGYEHSYRRVKNGDYEGAKGPTLLLGIVGLLLGGLVTGILYLVGWAKLGDAVNEMQRPVGFPYGPGTYPYALAGYSYAPAAAPYPYSPPPVPPAPPPGSALPPPPTPPCPRCGRPATFIAQYNRYYCYPDATYI